LRLVQVDAFTAKPFAGNPAAVCLLDEPRDTLWMQDVAREMNLSETAFVHRTGDGYGLRWFTPAVEVDLCGHATLAAAHVLWEESIEDRSSDITFETRGGTLTCRDRGDRIEMDFPPRPTSEIDPPGDLIDAVGVRAVRAGRSQAGYLLELPSEDAVRAAQPDIAALKSIPDASTCLTAPGASGGFDFVSRYFAPQAGVDEDPVTGSAHCALADWWSKRTGRSEFRAYQCSERGGVVHVRLDGDRVILGGQAVTVMRGELV
jgi:PhzF family phenazine biosynthesis protein